MFQNGAVVDPGTALAALEAGVSDAIVLDLHSATDHELTELLVLGDVQLNRASAAQRRVIAEIDSRRIAGELGSRSTSDLVAELLRVSHREAGIRVAGARTFGERRALTGEVLEPVIPLVAEALDTGEVSLAHGNVIADLLDKLPGDVEAEFGIEAQVLLLEHAAQVDPPTLAKIAVRLRDTLDQDGAADRDEQMNRSRSFTLVKHADGSYTPKGKLTPALGTALQTALDPLAAPRPSELGERDNRAYGQRMHDALLEFTKLGLKSGDLPASGGVATTIIVTTTVEQLQATAGVTTNAYGDLLPIGELAKLAVATELIPVVFDDLGAVMAYGRSRRLAPPGLRRALVARDKGCIIPGCTRPPSQCEAHHVTDWALLGETSIDEMALLCDYDHDTFEARGWKIEMIKGVPWCTPPRWLDPDQIPRQNTAHDQMMKLIPDMRVPEPT